MLLTHLNDSTTEPRHDFPLALAALVAKIVQLEDQLEKISGAVSAFEARSVDFHRKFDVDRSVVASLRQSVDRMSANVVSLKDRVEAMEAKDRSVGERLNKIQPEIDSLKKIVATLKRNVETGNELNPTFSKNGEIFQVRFFPATSAGSSL